MSPVPLCFRKEHLSSHGMLLPEHESGNCLPLSGNLGLQLHLWPRREASEVWWARTQPPTLKSPANSCLPWLAGGETEGENPLSSPECTCRVSPVVGLTEHHARHIPGQTAPHQLEQILSASGVWELACANSWEATVKHSGILPASRYLEISPGRSIYTKEIDTCYKPGLYTGEEGEAAYQHTTTFSPTQPFLWTQTMTRNSHLCFKRDCTVQ